MKLITSTALLMLVLTFAPMEPSFAGTETYLGEVSIFAGNYAPRGYAFCQGQLLSIADNTALFSIVGTTYGGDGRTTFALPDLRNAEKWLNGARYIIAVQGVYPSRQ